MSKNNAARRIMEYRQQTEKQRSPNLLKSNSPVTPNPSGPDPTVSSSPRPKTALPTGSEASQSVSLESNDSSVCAEPGCSGVSVELEETTGLTQAQEENPEQSTPKPTPGLKDRLFDWIGKHCECKCCDQWCATNIVAAINLTTAFNLSKTAARCAGGMIGLAMVFTADCWLEHPPFIGDVLGVLGSFLATVFLNSIEWEVIVSPNTQVHQNVILALLISYGIIFFQGGVVIWHLVQAPSHASHWEDECHEACCAAVEGYYCLLVLSGCSLLRFAVPLEGLQNADYNSLSSQSAVGNEGFHLGKGGSIGATVGAALLLVSGALFQLFASFGKYGSGSAVLVPMPIVLTMPLILITRVKSAQSGVRFGVWTGWECFIPAMLYVFVTLWPFALFHRRFLEPVQLVLCSCAVISLLTAARCLVCIIESKADSGTSQRMKWNFGF